MLLLVVLQSPKTGSREVFGVLSGGWGERFELCSKLSSAAFGVGCGLSLERLLFFSLSGTATSSLQLHGLGSSWLGLSQRLHCSSFLGSYLEAYKGNPK